MPLSRRKLLLGVGSAIADMPITITAPVTDSLGASATAVASVSNDSSFALPADRTTIWQPGVTYNTYAPLKPRLAGSGVSGIPARNTIHATISPSGDTSGATDYNNIQGAINSCPSGQVVKLAAGVFHGQGLVMRKDITLRGSGSGANLSTGINGVSSNSNQYGKYTVDPSATQIIGTAGSGTYIVRCGYDLTPNSMRDKTPLAADALHGSNQLRLSAIPVGLGVGDIVLLDQTTLVPLTTSSATSSGNVLQFGPGSIPPAIAAGQRIYAPPRQSTNYTYMLAYETFIQSVDRTAGTITLTANVKSNIPSGTFVTVEPDPEMFWGYTYNPDAFTMDAYGWFCCSRFNARQQLIEVSAIDLVNRTITSVMPIRGDFKVALGAQITRWNSDNPFQYGVGIEDMFLWNGEHGNIAMGGCAYSWVKNVDSGWGRGGDGMETCYKCEFRDSFFHESPDCNPGGGGYKLGIATGASDCLIENCVAWYGNKVIVMQGCGPGNVVAYCAMDDAFGTNYPSGPEAGLNGAHFVGSNFTLFEGNYSFNFNGDTYWGSTAKHVCLRNWFSGLRAAAGPLAGITATPGIGNLPYQPYRDLDYSGRAAIVLQAHSHNQSFVGNILGYPGQAALSHTAGGQTWMGGAFHYEDTTGGTAGNETCMWKFGNDQSGGLNIWDPSTVKTVLRQGNWDWFTKKQIWYANIGDTGAASTGPAYALPNSLYLPGHGAAPPAFWAGNPWPWIDPSTGTTHTLPAKARMEALLGLSPIPPGNNT